jgi:hypothetical protein
MATMAPKLFVSYSWSTPEHEAWVLSLATALRDDGVDVILDKWDLKEGHDAYKFMEQMVSNPDVRKVALVCDSKYVEKANNRKGGVGAEAQIISPEIYVKEDQSKFVAVVAERDTNGLPFLPTYYQSRIYIDLSENDLYAKNYEQLLRWIFDKSFYIKPELGTPPGFLSDPTPSRLGTSPSFRRALDAVRTKREYRLAAVTEYFDRLVQGFESLRLQSDGGPFDDKVIASIEEFLPYRNEAIEITDTGVYRPEYDVEALALPKIATDDSHRDPDFGRAWIEVDAPTKTADAILRAVKAGDFRLGFATTKRARDIRGFLGYGFRR